MLKKFLAVSLLGSTLAFVGCQSVPQLPGTTANLNQLQNKTWVATKIGNATLITNPTERNIASLQFDEATKRVTGSDGCNRLMGSFDAGRHSISFSQVASTRMACLNNANVDQLFNKALSQVTSYKVDGKKLYLLDAQGTTQIEFESAIQPR